jgi:hypothetical protein
MGDSNLQFKADEDNCIYFYDTVTGKWRKVCDIDKPDDLPLSVKRQVREIKDKAQVLPNV